ncbi:hypothetical protein D3C81_767730 [compost metagenome]
MRTPNILYQDYNNDQLNATLTAAKLLNWDISNWTLRRDSINIRITKTYIEINITITIKNNQYHQIVLEKQSFLPPFDENFENYEDHHYNHKDKNKAFEKVMSWL